MAFLHGTDTAFHGLAVSTQQGNRFFHKGLRESSLLSIGVLPKRKSEKLIWGQAIAGLVGFVVCLKV